MRNRRITRDEKALLVEAIEQGQVANATDFAEAFAQGRGLKPDTVRTAISRIRRERGYLTRGPHRTPGGVGSLTRSRSDMRVNLGKTYTFVFGPGMEAVTGKVVKVEDGMIEVRGATSTQIHRGREDTPTATYLINPAAIIYARTTSNL